LEAIEQALALLRGRHDFRGFRSSQCQSKRTVLDLEQASFMQSGDLLAFDFKCRSFLHHMIRFLAGTLISVGLGQMNQERLLQILEEGDRPRLILCAPPQGLCLMRVGYAAEECAAIRAAAPPPPSF
jgi:tRNA pseudouridine38-40 synthase